MEPKAHCDDMVVGWKAMMDKLGVRYDRFIRTTDDDHQTLVQNVLTTLHEAGEISYVLHVGNARAQCWALNLLPRAWKFSSAR